MRNEIKNLTPAQNLGYKVGDRFITEGSTDIEDGRIVSLCIDDGTTLPVFRIADGKGGGYHLCDGHFGVCISLAFVRPIDQASAKTKASNPLSVAEEVSQRTQQGGVRMIEAREIKQLVCNEGELTALCTDSTVWHRKWRDDGDGTAYEWVQGPGIPHREITATGCASIR